MNEDLKILLSTAREKKNLSQRKLARMIGIHHSTLNDIENGKIKKIDIEILRKIAEELDLSLKELLKAAGYDNVVSKLYNSSLETSSTKDLKKLLEDYKSSQLDLLDDAFKKRENIRKCRLRLNSVIEKLEKINVDDNLINELKQINKDLTTSMKKYDYSKLPKDNI